QKVEAKVPPEVQTADALLKSSIQQEDLETKMNEIRAQFPTLDTSSPISESSSLTEVRPMPETTLTLRLESNYPPGLPQNLEKRYAETKSGETSSLDEAVSKQVAFWESKSRHGD
ncbi:MAG: hypothetical protein K2X66_07735, partial [Cyanobacteria bacterium]|nr:hypothetical protein [Cyanobacteriota bacterium]